MGGWKQRWYLFDVCAPSRELVKWNSILASIILARDTFAKKTTRELSLWGHLLFLLLSPPSRFVANLFIHLASTRSKRQTYLFSLSLSLLFLLFPWARVFVWAKSFLRNVERREVSNFEIATFPSVLFKGSKNYFQSKNKNRFFLITETRIESNWNL